MNPSFPWLFPDSLKIPWLFIIFSKFPDFSLTGKSCLIFPGFPVSVGTLISTKALCCRWNVFSRPDFLCRGGGGGGGSGCSYEIRNFCFQSPPGHTNSISMPPLWWLTGLQFWWQSPIVKVDKTCRRCCHFYSGITFTVSDETYRCCPV